MLLALAASTPLALALSLTLFPGPVQRALHGYDAFVQACVAALYGIGERLPPVGPAVLALALAMTLAAIARGLALVTRTRSLTARCRPVPTLARVATVAERLRIGHRLTVFASPAAIAFTAGLVRPRVYISTAALDALEPDELEAVLLHERAHLVAHDPLRIAAARLIASALFFLPLADALRRRFELAKELDADREVVVAQQQVAALAGALERLGPPSSSMPLRHAVGAWSSASARIGQLEGTDVATLLPRLPLTSSWLTALALAALVCLALAQAMRANVVPAAAWELSGAPMTAKVHACPVPLEGPLL